MTLARVLLLAALLAVAAALPSAAGATRECDGLDVCIRVPGPWVAVPAQRRGAPPVAYQLSCPRGSIVGGLDAVRTARSLDVVFLGQLGSPVNPGITTGRAAVFVATSAARGVTAFRPLLGCIPTSGGGGRRTTSVRAAAPRPAVLRRVRTFRLSGAARSSTLRCARGERLLSSSHAVAYRTPSPATPPAVAVLGAVRVTARAGADRVSVRARRSRVVPAGVRVEVQVHAVCGRTRP